MANRFQHLVVVHGIGDQKMNQTVIDFVNAFVRSMPRAVLDHVDLHNIVERSAPQAADPAVGRPAFLIIDREGDRDVIAFSEVYWQPVTSAYLAEHRQPPIPIFSWARSIALRLVKERRKHRVAREIIANLETMLSLLRRLAFLYKKTALFADILDRFLGDVQMYVEDETLRARINNVFLDVMENDAAIAAEALVQLNAHTAPPCAAWDDHAIYVVAHSEGTVVSYNSIVQAAKDRESAPGRRAWLPLVRGFVTLGSPLNTHYTIWKNRFRTHELSGPAPAQKIRWFNYWDRSDPVAFSVRAGLHCDDPASDAAKLFTLEYDAGFARYPLPGLAHVGYWTDTAIHRDILQKLMGIGPPRTRVTGSRWWGREWLMSTLDWLSYLLGRAVNFALMAFFLMHLTAPLHVQSVGKALCTMPGFACATAMPADAAGWTMAAAWIFAPIAALKLWQELDVGAAGKLLRGVLFGLWLAATALILPGLVTAAGIDCCTVTGFTDLAGYATGLAASVLIWQLHTTVQKGIVQMWRATYGFKEPPRPTG